LRIIVHSSVLTVIFRLLQHLSHPFEFIKGIEKIFCKVLQAIVVFLQRRYCKEAIRWT